MSITIIKEGNTLKLIDSSDLIPEGTHLVLYTADELWRRETERHNWLDVQMPSFLRGDADEPAEELF